MGIHTMIDEHFRDMHRRVRSGGRGSRGASGDALDIVRDQPDGFTGFTADSVEEYAEILGHLLSMRK